MALFGKKKKKRKPLGPPQDPKWTHGEGGRFAKFLDLDPEAAGLDKKSAVFAIWHTGVQPGWVYIGRTSGLASTFFTLGDHEEILKSARVEAEAEIAEVTKLARAEDAAAHLQTDKDITQQLNNLQQRIVKFSDASQDEILKIANEISLLIADKFGVPADKEILKKTISKNS